MAYPYNLSFKKTLAIKEDGSDLLIINPGGSSLRIKKPSSGIWKLLDTLQGTGGTEDDLCNSFIAGETHDQTARFWYYLQQFENKGFICRSLILSGHHLCTLIPASPYFNFKEAAMDTEKNFVLSRFAYCRNHDGNMILESPLGHAILELGGKGFALLSELSKPISISGIHKKSGIGEAKEIHAFLTLLMNIKALEYARPMGPFEAEKTALTQWDFHDLLFHTRSRLGRHENPIGGTFRFLEKIDPLPALKPKMTGKTIALYRPDLNALRKEDLPFTQVLETRQSIREYSPNSQTPLTIDQVGEFLFRSARVKTFHEQDPKTGNHYQSTTRPSPGGGAMHGIEIYPLINECDGIEPGLYHYDPLDHELCLVSGKTDHTEKLLDHACTASNLQYEPGILFVMAARFQRTAWKYESIAYSAVLKDLGALYQTFYLVATSMCLAPCALGAGDSDLFARGSGLNYYTEASIGEFLLGSRPI